MSMDIRLAHSFPSVDATVSDQSSQQSPDGLAANVVLHGSGSLGKPWVATAAATSMSCKLTFGSAITPTLCLLVTNASDAATVTLRRDPDSADELVGTLERCKPTSTWLDFFSTTSDDEWLISISDAGAPDPLICYFAALGTHTQLSGGATIPTSARQHADPSLGVQLRDGSTVFNPQPRMYRKTVEIHGGYGDDSLSELQTILDTVGVTEPVLFTTDATNFNDRGVTVFGRFEAVPEEPLEGAMVRYPLTIQELR